ncbi:MAG: HAMP domain-containing protein [Bacteroidetes bacterium]|nr:HAMP domain-containing protein [Bacteroidota bacterium]
MFKNLTIRKKILVSVLTINFIMFLAIYLIYFQFSKNLVTDQTQEMLSTKVDEMISRLEGNLIERGKIGWTVCNNADFVTWLDTNSTRFVEPEKDPVFRKFREYGNTLVTKDGEINSVFLASEKTQNYYDNIGYRVDDAYRVGSRPWYKDAVSQKNPSFDFDIDYSSGEILANYRHPIYAGNRLVGVGGIDIRLETINNMMSQYKIFDSGYAMLLGKDGTILYHPDEAIMLKTKIDEYINSGNNESISVSGMLSKERGMISVTLNDESRVLLYSPFKSLDWILVLNVAEEEINGSLSTLTQSSLVFFLLGFGILTLAIIFTANSIAEPIKRLAAGIHACADEGSLDVELDVDSNDEVGDLGRSFHRMLTSLKSKVATVDLFAHGHISAEVEIISGKDELGRSMGSMRNRIGAVIAELDNIARAVTEGDLGYSSDLSKFEGEYAKIIKGINDVIGELLIPVREASDSLSHLSQKDLTARMRGEYKGDNAKLKNSFNTAVENLETILHQVRNSSDQNLSALFEIKAIIEELVQQFEQQANQTIEASTSIEEMAHSIIDNATNAQDMSNTATKSRESAEKGGEVVKQTITGMKEISAEVNNSAHVVQELGESSKNIGEIIRVIEDIADQTNLLALNAAIEAARAGEQGRGFAVVADEVRKLAEKTTKATGEISEKIKKIQTDTKDAVTSMESAKSKTDDGIKLADEAGKALQEIVQISAELTEKVVRITSATNQQSEVSQTLSEKIEQMNSGSQSSMGKLNSIDEYLENFAQLTENVNSLNNQFIISNGHSEKLLQ